MAFDADSTEQYWDAQLAIVGVIVCYAALPERLSLGPRWLIPAIGSVLLAVLVATTPYPWRDKDPSRGHRRLALTLLAVLGAAVIASAAKLLYDIVDTTGVSGRSLLGAAGIIWFTTILIFAVGYWELDRGGPSLRAHAERGDSANADFFFPQMDNGCPAPPGWMPSFVDYLYVALTNGTAFSPTDTMPLTSRAKLVMGLQGATAFATAALITARAVNILQ